MSFPTPHPLENFQSLAVDDQDVKEKKKFWGWADKRRDVEDEERGRTKVKEGDDVGSAISGLVYVPADDRDVVHLEPKSGGYTGCLSTYRYNG